MKPAIIIAYKNRPEYLSTILKYLPQYLENKNKITNYDIIVSEQINNSIFNKSISLNTGIKYAIENLGSDYVIIHDVDMIPVRDVDYNYRGYFMPWFVCAGGIIAKTEDFITINGYCNTYYGWGDEDVDIIKRALFYNLDVREWRANLGKAKPIIVNLEFAEDWDSLECSKKYWGTEWPRYYKSSEYGISHAYINKKENWYIEEYRIANNNRCNIISNMTKQKRDSHYRTSGLNQIDISKINKIEEHNKITKICYNSKEIIHEHKVIPSI